MIFFVVKRYHEYTIGNFLQTWARDLVGKVAMLTYEDCAYATRLHRGTYVFTDFERISQPQLWLAQAMATEISRAGWQILNHPIKVLDRYQLQTRLREAGINDFRVFRPDDNLEAVRFPVFVRRISEHSGAIAGLIDSHESLRAELRKRCDKGERDLIIVEKLDVRDTDGFYRKYGVFRCGEHFIPRHAYVSNNWVQSSTDLVDEAKAAAEAAYIEADPHRVQMMQVFDIAQVDYGRADYGLFNGRVQVWEINTNPMMMIGPSKIDPLRLGNMARATARVIQSVARLDEGTPYNPAPGDHWIDFSVEPELRASLGVNPADDMLRLLGRGLGILARLPGVQGLVNTCQRARWLASR